MVATATIASSLLGVASVAPAAVAASKHESSAPAGPVAQRPDRVSAMMAARSQQHRVEVLSERTDRSETFANPDGSWTTTEYTGPVRVKDGRGAWHGIDTTLVQDPKSGSWHPRWASADLSFSNGGTEQGGTEQFASLVQGTRSYAVSWPGRLPKPKVSGDTATYTDVQPGVDLVLKALPTGFSHVLVVRKRPVKPLKFALPTRTSGLNLSRDKAGHLRLATRTGKLVASAPAPQMWDAATDPRSGEPAHVAVIPTQVSTGTNGGQGSLELSPGQAFFDDSKVVYPVTVDPAATLAATTDTWVQNPDYPDSQVSSAELKAGTYDTGADVARSYLKFDVSPYMGKHITDTDLQLYSFYSSTCSTSGAGIQVRRITSNWDSSAITWGAQPTTSTTDAVTNTAALGYNSSCPAGNMHWDVDNIVKSWTSGASPNYGLQLRGASETDPFTWRRFRSANYVNGANDPAEPHLTVTYTSPPGTPVSTSAAPLVTTTLNTIKSTSASPAFSAKSTDADGGNVTLTFEVSHDPAYTSEGTGVMWTGTKTVASGATGTVTMPATVIGTTRPHIQWRVKASDGTDTSAWSGYSKFGFNVTPPNAPTVTCPDFTAGLWSSHTGSEVCTLDTTSSDGAGYYWSLDSPTDPTTKLVDPNGNGGDPLTVAINPTAGWHTLYATAYDDSYNRSTIAALAFGVGTGSVLTPADGDRTQASVALTVRAGAPRNQATYQYHVGELASAAWTTVPASDVTLPGTGTHPTWPQTRTDTSQDFTELDWNVAQTLANAGKGDGPVQIEACFQTNGGAQSCSPPVTITVERTAFGSSYATRELGPGTASLLTGDYSVEDTDVDFGDLAVSRSHTTLSPPAAATGPTGMFGAGWSAALSTSTDAGAADYTLEDHTVDGYVLLVGADGSTLSYVQQGTSTSFTGISEAADGSVLTADTASNPGSFTLADTDGSKTTWTRSGSSWSVSQVTVPGINGTTTFNRDAQGRVTRITAPAPTGVACTTLVRGCKALTFTYASSTTTTGTAEAQWGDSNGLVSQISYTAWDPVTSTMKPVTVAQYLYDSTGHLRAYWDPRVSPALKTRYTYDATGRISTVSPPGFATWTLAYDSKGRIASVSHPDPANGTATQAVAYGVAITGSGAPIDLSGAQTSTWGQSTDLPVSGAAVFPASHVPTAGSGGAYAPTATDWKYAGLSYLDVNGREVDTATYGGGTWQIDSQRYDSFGHTVWTMSAGNRAQALSPTADTDPYVAAQADSVSRADLLASTSVYTADGSDLVSLTDAAHPVQLADGTVASAQLRTTYTYDEGKPDTNTYHLVTTTVTGPVVLDGQDSHAGQADFHTTRTGYNPIDGKPATDPTSGWVLYRPTTQTTVVPGGTDIVNKSRFDADGQTVETRKPASNGADAGTTLTTYYTAAANSAHPECGSRAEWNGMVCRTGPAAQPAGQPMPVSETTYTTEWALPGTLTETAGATVRTSTVSYDAAGRTTGNHLAVTPAPDGGAPVGDTTFGYDPATGEQATVSSADGSVLTTGRDSLGRVVSYTDATGHQTTTTTYTIDGQVATVNDGKGTTTYTYDGTDASGQEEHRGLVTRVDTGMGTAPSVFRGSYDADGNASLETFPNGMTATSQHDNADQLTTLSYTMSGWTNPLVFSQTASPFGQTVAASTPESQQQFGYDPAGRLTRAQDDDATAASCNVRNYTLNANTDRTALTAYADAGDGICTTATTPTVTTHTYDSADRITDTGYSYDTLGRTLTAPAADLANGANLNIGYYANDMVASLTQGAETRTFTLDPAMRLSTVSDTGGAQPGTTTNHYSDNSDSPTWISEADGSWTRNVTGLSGGLGAIQKSDGTVSLQVTDPRGNLVATVADDPTAVGPDWYAESTEYGAPRTGAAPARYSWLGAEQRPTDAPSGIMLMGARLYTPLSGRFLSEDPVAGGSCSGYEYSCADPVNKSDTTGSVTAGCRTYSKSYKVYEGSVPLQIGTIGMHVEVCINRGGKITSSIGWGWGDTCCGGGFYGWSFSWHGVYRSLSGSYHVQYKGTGMAQVCAFKYIPVCGYQERFAMSMDYYGAVYGPVPARYKPIWKAYCTNSHCKLRFR